MIEFTNVKKEKANKNIKERLTNCTCKIKLGSTKTINGTNLKVIEPTIYTISKPFKLTIYEYDIKEVNDKPYYIKEHNKKYSLNEILSLLNRLK